MNTVGFYYGLVLYGSGAVLVYFNFILGNLDNPWDYCKRLLGIIPVVILFSYLIPNNFFIFLVDTLGFAISIFASIWSIRNIVITQKRNSYFSLPFISLLISICFVLDFLGTISGNTNFFLLAELASGSVICYTVILERFFPFLFYKATVTNIDNELELENITIPKTPLENKYPPRDLLEGIDLEKVEIKLNSFLESKGFKDEELRLPDFASGLGLSTHQASHYLNKFLNMNYSDFLNHHRIYEVMNMIRTRSNFNLLNIAVECGFNSASSFHRACVKFTGKSPRNLKKYIQFSESNKKIDTQNTKIQTPHSNF
ncbi:DNA-binding helix-turn-helix protein [Leptospira weilii serovar Ranarum str. ICFT]|uniref:DNA-binding helix-turn-helix protein n=1 Tax=Leptospira weilii serovar Ranarum str. ICFT TaxID=1218598 RepID=N1WLQ4_9LEPT|nr:helix-turn-helix domain-containing protein [Leptospira weilii]EMY76728.1 DNA-binding helix-turn-helix protein [Leptospira weilii serovar Ranarum str. ICFT]